ncbi:hypothetical protein SARC_07465 [Sphaeroforma arctica JP610]|uniref:DUF1764 domain-containing protein n=1 Tax=Sphaeroforma arctica JP610 TaxID=667725 RepID=A0A0L0FTP3_9EUKA|nr:hypothetical protein SARC_07465 [Sphaeroforma arctica JP610]KNC80172.1 hypothetical protein SARC_07465 [Sphaeroforma arctica JP610]|eukprot:XP_014154074.1 hypothetical protein SARC_07465 [Sphaeroforma arctica JP610]
MSKVNVKEVTIKTPPQHGQSRKIGSDTASSKSKLPKDSSTKANRATKGKGFDKGGNTAKQTKTKGGKGSDIDNIFAAAKPTKKSKQTSEIDDIFSSATSKKKSKITHEDGDGSTDSDALAGDESEENVYSKLKNKKRQTAAVIKPADDDDDFFDARGLKNSKRRKFDGCLVYHYDELKLSANAGKTDDCPFDCRCCY